METVTLKSGIKIPILGLGTFEIPENNFNSVISDAIECGYSLFDTATGYDNHIFLAKALQQQKNANIFICTKFNNNDLIKHNTVEKLIQHILLELNLKYIDLLLIHNPKVENFYDVFEKLIQVKKSGTIGSLGVSNFTIKHLNLLGDLIEHVDVNQIELHPLFTQLKLKKYCEKYNIKIMAYRPFGYGSLEILKNKTLSEIALKHAKSIAQIVLRWVVQQKCIVIPKTSNKSRLQENIDIFNFQLSDFEMNEINALNKNFRTCSGPWADFEDDK